MRVGVWIGLWMGLVLGGGATAQPARTTQTTEEKRNVTFRYGADESATSVALAGTFNKWDRTANFMSRQADGKTWVLTLPLAPGVYQYKFVVNGEKWFPDPNAPNQDDGNGNINSVLTVKPMGYEARPARRGDGQITLSAVLHQPTGRDLSRVDKTHFRFLLRTRRDDVRGGDVAIRLGGEIFVTPLGRSRSDELFDYWSGVAELPDNRKVTYLFRLHDGSVTRYYDRKFTLDPRRYPIFTTPDWARDAVFYHIFPERFANGDNQNDPADVAPWASPPTYFNWMGGDLAGVLQRFDHLRELGINALYFNPIFAARSNHAYDTTDYEQVDPRFGTNEQLKQLVSQAHAQGWRVILDGVFNHTGVDFRAFASLRKDGERSPYRAWYYIRGFPVEVKDGQTNYEGWYGSPWMPKINLTNGQPRAYFLDIATRWIREVGIDGWRLDAANEVPQDYWRIFRKTVRRVRPNAYLVGEVWGDAAPWLQGDQWDSAMNYRWRGAALDFFAFDRVSPSQFEQRLRQIRDDYPPAATAVMFNMLGSHDVERLRTLCRGDARRHRQAALFQLTYPGTPCIYYGDEIGMEGGRDPDNRRAMNWNRSQWDTATFTFYKRLLALRRQKAVLRRGEYEALVQDDARGVFGFARYRGGERVLMLFNRSDQVQRVSLSAAQVGSKPFSLWMGEGAKVGRKGTALTITLPERGMALLGPVRK